MHFYDEPGEFTEEVLGDWFDRVWKHYTSTRPEFWCGLSIFGAQVDENGKTIGDILGALVKPPRGTDHPNNRWR